MDLGQTTVATKEGGQPRKVGRPSFAITPTDSHRWTCSSSRQFRFGNRMAFWYCGIRGREILWLGVTAHLTEYAPSTLGVEQERVDSARRPGSNAACVSLANPGWTAPPIRLSLRFRQGQVVSPLYGTLIIVP
jgi:hypothetical protein